MAKSKKPAVLAAPKSAPDSVLNSWTEVDLGLLSLGKTQIIKQRLEAEINQRIARVHEQFQNQVQAVAENEAHITGEIEQYFLQHKGDLPGGTFSGTYGKVSYKLNPPKVIFLAGRKEENVVGRFEEIGRQDVLRTKTVLNREAVLDKGLDPELEKLGVRIARTASLKTKPDLKKIAEMPDAAAKAG